MAAAFRASVVRLQGSAMQGNPPDVLMVALFAVLWLTVTGVLSLLSGWFQLARRFPASEKPAGTRLSAQVTSIGLIGENRVTLLSVSPAGLGLNAVLMFRFMRRPILVPWSEVRYVSTRTILWWRTHVFDLGGITRIRVKRAAFDLMQPFVCGAPGSKACGAGVSPDQAVDSTARAGDVLHERESRSFLARLIWLSNLAAVVFNAGFSILAIVTLCGIVFITRPKQVMHEISPEMWLPLLIVMAPAQIYSQFLAWSTIFSGRPPTGPAIAMRQAPIPSALRLLVATWWLLNFAIGFAIVVSLGKPPGRPVHAVALFIVAAIAFWLSFAANVYLLLAVRTLTTSEEPLNRVWRWRIAIDLAMTAVAVLYYGL
jgi:hypothetical protein